MTAAAFSGPISAPRSTPVHAWAGRVLTLGVAGFLGLEGLARVAWGAPLVEASRHATGLDSSAQTLVGLTLLVGAGLQLTRFTRWAGLALLLAALGGLIAVEATATRIAPDHLLFWAYLAALLITGVVLRVRTAR